MHLPQTKYEYNNYIPAAYYLGPHQLKLVYFPIPLIVYGPSLETLGPTTFNVTIQQILQNQSKRALHLSSFLTMNVLY